MIHNLIYKIEIFRIKIFNELRRDIANLFDKIQLKFYKRKRHAEDIMSCIIFYLMSMENQEEKKIILLLPKINKYKDDIKTIIENKLKYSYTIAYGKTVKNNFLKKCYEHVIKYAQLEKDAVENFKYDTEDVNVFVQKHDKRSYNMYTNDGYKINIENVVYGKLRSYCIDKSNANLIIYNMLLRYYYTLKSGNNQLKISTEHMNMNINEFMEKNNITMTNKKYAELYASPVNRHLENYCSAFPDTDKYFRGRLGTFNTYKFESNKIYLCNPPYVNFTMELMSKKIRDKIHTIKNTMIYIIIPVWDLVGMKKCEIVIDEDIEDNYKDYKTLHIIQSISDDDVEKSYKLYKKNMYQFINMLTGKKINASNIYEIILYKI